MAPKRKAQQADKVGVARQYLKYRFQVQPAGLEEFLKGHVLNIYYECDSSRGATVRELLNRLPCSSSGMSQDQVLVATRHLTNEVKKTVKAVSKFRHLTIPSEFTDFDSICQKKFELGPVSFDVSFIDVPMKGASKDTESPVTDAFKDTDLPTEGDSIVKDASKETVVHMSPLKTRQIFRCHNCKILRKTNQDLRQKPLQVQHDKMDIIKAYCSKKKLNISIKRMNQKIKRKGDQIKKVQQKFDMSTLAMEVSETKKQISSLERKNKCTKHYYRNKSQKVLFPLEAPGEIETLYKQLAEKNTVILELQDEKSDGKVYSSDTRMMVFNCIISQTPTAHIYSYFNDKEFQESRIDIISNISNTLTDRCAANHVAIELLNETWDKHLNELYCHLHPLDMIATSMRSAMNEYEKRKNN